MYGVGWLIKNLNHSDLKNKGTKIVVHNLYQSVVYISCELEKILRNNIILSRFGNGFFFVSDFIIYSLAALLASLLWQINAEIKPRWMISYYHVDVCSVHGIWNNVVHQALARILHPILFSACHFIFLGRLNLLLKSKLARLL